MLTLAEFTEKLKKTGRFSTDYDARLAYEGYCKRQEKVAREWRKFVRAMEGSKC